MNKQTVVYSYNGILRDKKKWTPFTYNNIDESQKHYAEWKKPHTKEYILYDSIYVNRETI